MQLNDRVFIDSNYSRCFGHPFGFLGCQCGCKAMHDRVVGVEDPAVVVGVCGGGSVCRYDGRFDDRRVPMSLSWELRGSCEIICVDDVGICWRGDDIVALLGLIESCRIGGKAKK